MAWTAVYINESDPFHETISRDGSVRATAGDTYYVESDTVITLDQALAASFDGVTIPAPLASYSTTRPNCRCRGRTVTGKTAYQFLVHCAFEDATDGGNSTSQLAKASRCSSRPESFTEGYVTDAEDTPVMNRAGEVFQQAPERQAAIKSYTVKKYVDATQKTAIKSAWNTNNSSSITIDGDTWAVDEGWLADYSFEPVDGSALWDATLLIKCKRGGWVDQPLNVGFRDADGLEIKIDSDGFPNTVNGEYPSMPWPLDEDGMPKDPGAIADALLFYPYGQSAWTGVPLS